VNVDMKKNAIFHQV